MRPDVTMHRLKPSKYEGAHKKASCNGPGSSFERDRYKIHKPITFHCDIPFSPIANRSRMGNNIQKHKEGTIQKATIPVSSNAGCR